MNNIDHIEYFHPMQVVQYAPPDSVIVETSEKYKTKFETIHQNFISSCYARTPVCNISEST